MHNKYVDHTVFQLEDTRKPGKIETKDAKVTIFSILSAKPKRKVGSKGKMSYQIVDEIRIVGLQNYNLYEKLNPIEINIHNSEIQGKLWRYGTQRYKYRFITDSLLMRDSLINGKLYKSLGVININKIRDWTKIKGDSKWINIVFNGSENPTIAKHFLFAFEIVTLSDLLNF